MSIVPPPIPIPADDVGEPWPPSSALQPKERPSPYLRGPIPWSWLQAAIRLGCNALSTGLAIWHLRALMRSMEFKGSLRRLGKCSGLSVKQTRTGLHRLERAGLVKVSRAAGRTPTITLIAENPSPAETAPDNNPTAESP